MAEQDTKGQRYMAVDYPQLVKGRNGTVVDYRLLGDTLKAYRLRNDRTVAELGLIMYVNALSHWTDRIRPHWNESHNYGNGLLHLTPISSRIQVTLLPIQPAYYANIICTLRWVDMIERMTGVRLALAGGARHPVVCAYVNENPWGSHTYFKAIDFAPVDGHRTQKNILAVNMAMVALRRLALAAVDAGLISGCGFGLYRGVGRSVRSHIDINFRYSRAPASGSKKFSNQARRWSSGIWTAANEMYDANGWDDAFGDIQTDHLFLPVTNPYDLNDSWNPHINDTAMEPFAGNTT